MKQFLGAFLGMIVGGVVLAGVGVGAVGLLAAGGMGVWLYMAQGDFQSAAPTSAHTVSASRRAPAPSARDGELQIHTFAAVQIQVDGQALYIDQLTGNYTTTLTPGTHVVQVFNMWMKEVAREQVTIRPGKRLMLEYVNKQKVFTRVGEIGVSAPPPPQVQVQVQAPAPQPQQVLLTATVAQPSQPVQQATVQMAALEEQQPQRGGMFGGIGGMFKAGGDSSTTQSSSSSSTRYGEVNAYGPGHSETHGYQDTQNDSVETKKSNFWRR